MRSWAVLRAHERRAYVCVCVSGAMLKRCDEIFNSAGRTVGGLPCALCRRCTNHFYCNDSLKTLLQWTLFFHHLLLLLLWDFVDFYSWMRRKTFNVPYAPPRCHSSELPPPPTLTCAPTTTYSWYNAIVSAEICCCWCCTRFFPADLILITNRSCSFSLSLLGRLLCVPPPSVSKHSLPVFISFWIQSQNSLAGSALISPSFVPCTGTVSYTHLDVYKRQGLDSWKETEQ